MIYTLGHSTRTIEEFIKILKQHGIETVVDVRHFPSSRFSWFNKGELKRHLMKNGMRYFWLEDLGGFRKIGYKKYIKTEKYRKGVEKLLEISKLGKTAIMCAEYKWWKCHRRYISDTLTKLGKEVVHIMNEKRLDVHKKKETTIRCDR